MKPEDVLEEVRTRQNMERLSLSTVIKSTNRYVIDNEPLVPMTPLLAVVSASAAFDYLRIAREAPNNKGFKVFNLANIFSIEVAYKKFLEQDLDTDEYKHACDQVRPLLQEIEETNETFKQEFGRDYGVILEYMAKDIHSDIDFPRPWWSKH